MNMIKNFIVAFLLSVLFLSMSTSCNSSNAEGSTQVASATVASQSESEVIPAAERVEGSG